MPQVEIDVDDFLIGCSRHEIKELVEALKEDGHLDDEDNDKLNIKIDGRGYDAHEFETALHKLATNYHSLTKEQTDIIINLSKRF